MLELIKSRAFLVALGLALLAVLLWFLGPYFAFADYRPLEGVVARLIAIIVIAVVYAVYVQLRQLKSSRANRQLAAEVSKDDGGGAEAGGRGSPGDAAQLKKRFEEAIEALKKTRKKGSANLYELPWYIIIGPPGAGKTTVLVNSGLNFPLAQKFGKEALRGVGGTRNCDWWFTDQAILLDTAGRYTTQDSNARADAAGWSAFLQLLRKFRGRQPINGVILAMSASDLLVQGEREREQHVTALRERLDELGRNLKIEVPVYFLVTKCDLVAGFTEFFDELGQEARSQVWGVTFPIDATESGRAAGLFEGEFDRLIERLQQRVLGRMEGERDPRRRVGILSFPQQIATLKPLLNDLLKRVFTGSDFDHQVLLRGVYFTSGTQEGTPVDRMLGAIARTFGLTSAVAAPPAGRGKAFFIERLLKDVIFNESGLAGVNRRVQLGKIAAQSAAYIACVVVLVLGVLWLLLSYNRNAAYVDEVALSLQGLQAAGAAPAGTAPAAALARLDALRDVTGAAEKYQGHVPVSMRAGLYRGRALGEEARDAYARELNAVLLPALRSSLEQAMQQSAGAPDRLYQYLKAYLMLHDARHRSVELLQFMGQSAWRQMYSGDAATAQRVEEHFEQLLHGEHVSSIPINDLTVDQARAALSSARLPVLMYSSLQTTYQGDKRAIHLDVAAGIGAPLALVRRSGKPLTDPIPAIYTRAVFNEINQTRKYELIRQFQADSWVFGDSAFDLRRIGTLWYDVLGVYEADYIREWDGLIKDVAIKSASSPAEFADILGIISGSSSPLKGFLNLVSTNTDLLKPDTSLTGQATAALDKAADAALGPLKQILGTPPEGAAQPGAKVSAYFEKIRTLTDGPPGQAPIDQMLASLDQQHKRLQSTGSGVGQQSALDPQVQAAVADAKRSLDVLAKQLPGSLGSIVSEVASRSESIVTTQARGELSQRYSEQVFRECHELIEDRYPLNPKSPVDVALGDFGHVFGSGGVFDTFFQMNLAPLVDTSRPKWAWRAGAAAGPPWMLPEFQRAQRIRELYFAPGGKTPEARFNLSPDTLDASVTRFTLDIEGQRFEYRHGPLQSLAVSWPGTTGQAAFSFEDRGGGPIPGVTARGPWAWFRLLDQAHTVRDSETRYRVTFTAAGKSMVVILEAPSIRNPFGSNEVAGFRCAM